MSTWPVVGQFVRRVSTDGTIRNGFGDAFADGTPVPQEFVDDFRDTTFTSSTASRSGTMDWLDDTSAPERLRDAGVPLLAVNGGEDKSVEPAALPSWRAVPGARTELLPDVGHSPDWEAARRTAELIVAFDRGIRTRPRR